MKIFISSDLEGTTGISNWNETEKGLSVYAPLAIQMSKEVGAICSGLTEAGVKDILVKDAHDSAANIDINYLTKNTKLLKEWVGVFGSMMAGLDETYDGVFFTGYHCGVHSDKNPLAHTMSRSIIEFKINGKSVSEFHINSYLANHYGVPIIGITGDEKVCEEAKQLVPGILTVPVLKGFGNSSISIHPELAIENMKNTAQEAIKKLKKDKKQFSFEQPQKFTFEIEFLDHVKALRASYFPDVKRTGIKTIEFTRSNIIEALIVYMFIG